MISKSQIIGAALAMAHLILSTAAMAAEVVDGAAVFRKCIACHSTEPGVTKLGPSLSGVFGRKAGTLPAFRYSPAMVQSSITWDAGNLEKFLTHPSDLVPGTRMTFGGLSQPSDRAAIIEFLKGNSKQAATTAPATATTAPTAKANTPAVAATTLPASSDPSIPAGYIPDLKFTLRSGIAEGRMVFIGFGGAINGIVNPELKAGAGDIVQVTLINGEGAAHNIVFERQGPNEQDVASEQVRDKGSSTTLAFQVHKAGAVAYFCSLPGHRLAGMEGKLAITLKALPANVAEARDISMDPGKVPAPIGKREPKTVRVDLETVEVDGQLADGTTYRYWTFNGTVPGPMLRVRVGDTVQVFIKNDPDSAMIHSVDFHATTGPGGGAAFLQVEPGQTKQLDFKALVPGLYVYHCATPMVAHHIANGMYGMILVEPEGGLPPVDHEFYVMQGEIYTSAPFGQHGSQEFSVDKLLAEQPEYFVFNGAVGALTKQHMMHAKVGETVRLFMGVGGPNFTSSFHVIGEIFDRVYEWGNLSSPPVLGVQTVSVPPGGAVVTEFALQVPGRYLLVDHALSRLERGLLGFIMVDGEQQPDIFKPYSKASGSGH